MELTVRVDWRPDRNSELPVYRQIVEYVRGQIAAGQWSAGNRLPAQRELARLFGVNRSTVVAAMEELASHGLLESDHGGGTRVASDTWSLMVSDRTLGWNHYLEEGVFQANVPTIQLINKLEFEDTIRLGTGEPDPKLYPAVQMKSVLEGLAGRLTSMGYLGPLGLPELRNALSKRLAAQGIEAPPSNILITSGSLQALQLISVCLLQPGSVVYAEQPSYLRSLRVFQSAGMDLKGISMDREGLRYWEMEEAGDRTRLLYTIPTFQNPTGALMSRERREGLLHFCREGRIPVIEDTAYSELWLEEEPPSSLKAMDKHGMVLQLGTVSKSLLPGLRIGWLIGPEPVVARLGDVKMQVDYGASSLSQWVLTEWLESGAYEEHLTGLRGEMRGRRDSALAVLEEHFADLADWEAPKGGFYIWVRFRRGISVEKLFHEAMEQRILLNPGGVYSAAPSRALRLSYAYEDPKTFRKAARILAGLARRQLTNSG